MTFFDAIKTVFSKYAEFRGRATRSEFWWWTLFSTLVSAALNALSLPLYGAMYGRMMDYATPYSDGYGSFSLAGLWSIAVLLPSLAVAVRRLRDAGHAWTNLFWLLLPLAGVIVLIVYLCQPSVATSGQAPAAAAAAVAPPVATEPPATPVAPVAPAPPAAPAPKE